jgi:hypothetical protein
LVFYIFTVCISWFFPSVLMFPPFKLDTYLNIHVYNDPTQANSFISNWIGRYGKRRFQIFHPIEINYIWWVEQHVSPKLTSIFVDVSFHDNPFLKIWDGSIFVSNGASWPHTFNKFVTNNHCRCFKVMPPHLIVQCPHTSSL